MQPSRSRRRRTRRRDKRDRAGGSWMVFHCCFWVENPWLCSWGRNAVFETFPICKSTCCSAFAQLPSVESVLQGVSSPCWCHLCVRKRRPRRALGSFRVNLHSPGCWSLAPRAPQDRSVEPRAASQCPHRKPYSPVFLFLIKEGDAFLVVFVVCSFCLGVGEAPQGLMWMDVEIHGWCHGC